ncbi:hypothetical protein Zmor_022135 [Zophobas morio]|uniref:Uncharacterized protein n=1 Tax=Zophobas morio TaxID=2755281 RepID=A0AA38HVW3_9CUCU|nr:hypothetical protein Zmor_022135 [Zophobas morio]
MGRVIGQFGFSTTSDLRKGRAIFSRAIMYENCPHGVIAWETIPIRRHPSTHHFRRSRAPPNYAVSRYCTIAGPPNRNYPISSTTRRSLLSIITSRSREPLGKKVYTQKTGTRSARCGTPGCHSSSLARLSPSGTHVHRYGSVRVPTTISFGKKRRRLWERTDDLID